MKIPTLFAMLALAGSAQAVPYTDIYDIFQGGYDSPLPGSCSGVVLVTDNDGDGTISPGDRVFGGALVFRYSLDDGRPFLRGFDIGWIEGSSLLEGSFSLHTLSHIFDPAVITNEGGSVTVRNFINGPAVVYTTAQAPVITKRVSDSGATMGLLSMGLLGLMGVGGKRTTAA